MVRRYKIIVILQDLTSPKKYHITTLFGEKDIDSNTIVRLSTSTKNPNYRGISWEDTVRRIYDISIPTDGKRGIKPDFIVSNIKELWDKNKDIILCTYFESDKKREDDLISLFMGNERKLKSHNEVLDSMRIGDGGILRFMDNQSSRGLSLSITDVKPITWAFMFALRTLHEDRFNQLLRALEV